MQHSITNILKYMLNNEYLSCIDHLHPYSFEMFFDKNVANG